MTIAWIFELAGGAIGDFEDNCLPKEQRDAAWTVAALHQWDMGIDDPRCITSAEAVSSLSNLQVTHSIGALMWFVRCLVDEEDHLAHGHRRPVPSGEWRF